MDRILDYFIKRKILTVFAGIVVFYLIYIGIIQGLSFKINGDFYTILSTISACKNHLSGNFDASLFPDALVYSPHTNILSWTIALLSNIFGFEAFKAFYAIGPACLILFVFSFDFFLSKLDMSSPKRALVIITSFLLVPTVSSINYIGDGIFTLSDIFVTAMGWRILGFALFFICAGIILELEQRLSSKKVIALFVTSFLLCNVYLVNFVILLALIAPYCIYQKLSRKPVRNILIALTLTSLGGLANLFFWPYYNAFSLLTDSYQNFQTSLMVQNPEDYDKNSLIYYVYTLSLSLIALALLHKEKNSFVRISTIFCFLIVLLSLVVPSFNIPYFWRFAIFTKIFLIIIFFKNFKIKINSYAIIVIATLALSLSVVFTAKTLARIEKRQDDQGKLYQDLKKLDLDDGLILSDERTSNVIQGVDGYRVYGIPSGHIASREIAQNNEGRTQNLAETLKSHDYKKINKFLIANSISYIILNQEAEFTETFKLLKSNDLSFYPKLSQESELTVLKVNPLK